MYTRLLKVPNHSFFLFGPRATGKTTWLKHVLPDALRFDLLDAELLVDLTRSPSLFVQRVEALPKGSWAIVDEVQRLPALLDGVQQLIANHANKYFFALSGSSARKLRRLETNLLAGRVIQRLFYPLTGAEMAFSKTADELLHIGCLPSVHNAPDHAIDILEAYVATYLTEEIKHEALVKDLSSFSRFLEVAAIMNGQTVNVAGIARDAGVARPTVQRYFDTLVDTLVGTWVRPWKPQLKVRESAHPKFYFFDTGVVRALRRTLRDNITAEEKGSLLETLVLHELRAHNSIANLGGDIMYWRTPAKVEVDFIWQSGRKAVGFEVKASARWRTEHSKALKELLDKKQITKGYGIYLGDHPLVDGDIHILPLQTFQQSLAEGRLLNA